MILQPEIIIPPVFKIPSLPLPQPTLHSTPGRRAYTGLLSLSAYNSQHATLHRAQLPERTTPPSTVLPRSRTVLRALQSRPSEEAAPPPRMCSVTPDEVTIAPPLCRAGMRAACWAPSLRLATAAAEGAGGAGRPSGGGGARGSVKSLLAGN